MAVIDFSRSVSLGPEESWQRVTAFAEHGRFVAFTRVSLIDPAAPGGGGFIARTAVGSFGFDDVNVLERWEPPVDGRPGLAQLRKAGGMVRGWARITVTPQSAGGSEVRWQEWLSIRGVPRLCDPVLTMVGSQLFARVVEGLLQAA